jgi:hypothetical protein
MGSPMGSPRGIKPSPQPCGHKSRWCPNRPLLRPPPRRWRWTPENTPSEPAPGTPDQPTRSPVLPMGPPSSLPGQDFSWVAPQPASSPAKRPKLVLPPAPTSPGSPPSPVQHAHERPAHSPERSGPAAAERLPTSNGNSPAFEPNLLESRTELDVANAQGSISPSGPGGVPQMTYDLPRPPASSWPSAVSDATAALTRLGSFPLNTPRRPHRRVLHPPDCSSPAMTEERDSLRVLHSGPHLRDRRRAAPPTHGAALTHLLQQLRGLDSGADLPDLPLREDPGSPALSLRSPLQTHPRRRSPRTRLRAARPFSTALSPAGRGSIWSTRLDLRVSDDVLRAPPCPKRF